VSFCASFDEGLSELSKDDVESRELARFGVPLIDGRHALHECVEDLWCLPLERFRLEDLDHERLGRTKLEARHAVAFTDIVKAIHPRIHVPAVEGGKPERGRTLVVECVPIANRRSVQLRVCHVPFDESVMTSSDGSHRLAITRLESLEVVQKHGESDGRRQDTQKPADASRRSDMRAYPTVECSRDLSECDDGA